MERELWGKRNGCAVMGSEMREFSRRGAIGAAVGMGVSSALGYGHVAAFAQSLVPMPSHPLSLSRRLERSLHDGRLLVVSRSWEVEFTRQGQGIAITGTQLQAEVEAPPSLASFAEIEQSRSTANMWPILLSGNGKILVAGSGTDQEDIAAAIAEAEHVIASRPMPSSQQAAQRQFLNEMQQAGYSLLDRLPDDLFFPTGVPLQSTREISLPGGLTGQFEITYNAVAESDSLRLDHAERTILTRIGHTERHAREEWKLGEF